MKKEILRMEHVVCMSNDIPVLNHFSMQIFEGEIYGLLCLEQHGITKLIELLCRNLPIRYGQVFLQEKLVNSIGKGDNSKNKVTVIGSKSQLIDNLSLADNLFLFGSDFRGTVVPERSFRRRTRELLGEFHLSLDPSCIVGQLSAYERLEAELLRAIVVGNPLIVLWQISDLLSSEELPRFHALIRDMAGRGYSFLYVYYHHEVLRPVCDRVGIFQEGHIDKVLSSGEGMQTTITNVFARYAYDKLTLMRTDRTGVVDSAAVVFSMNHFSAGDIRDWNLNIRAGENVLLLDQSNTILGQVAGLFAGDCVDYEGTASPCEFLARPDGRVAVIPRNPVESALFPELSFLDNLCFPLGEKIRGFWGRRALKESVAREYRGELGELLDAKDLYEMHTRDLYTLIYYRYLIARPKLVVCMQPLSGVDMYVRTYILEMINRLCAKGIAVWVLNTELYDTLYAADRVIQVENGRIIKEYGREEFEELRVNKREIYPD